MYQRSELTLVPYTNPKAFADTRKAQIDPVQTHYLVMWDEGLFQHYFYYFALVHTHTPKHPRYQVPIDSHPALFM